MAENTTTDMRKSDTDRTKRKGFTEYDDTIENYGYCLRCEQWSFVPEVEHCPDCRARKRFVTGEACIKYAPTR